MTSTIAGVTIMPTLLPDKQSSRWGKSAEMKNAFIAQPTRYSIDSREIVLMPGEGMEIKYYLKQGGGVVYSWVADSVVLFDFHGEPDVKPEGNEDSEYFESYDRDDTKGRNQSHGTFIAPKSGIHGWYWENPHSKSVKIKLVSSGFYDWIFQNRNEQKSKLKPMDAYSSPSHPMVPDVRLR